jgi:hypothetical protein
MNLIECKNKEISDLKIKLNLLQKTKGSQCSINGNNYEKQIYSIVNKCYLNDNPFNTQEVEDLAGSSSKNDINCNYKSINDIGIEVKKYNTPDWMQCTIKYNTVFKKWIVSDKGKIPDACRVIFNTLINNINLFNGKIPPFMINPMTHEEWLKIKSVTKCWDDIYIDIPKGTIRQLYSIKGCNYIQISDTYGLYHLETDVCGFNVPLFEIDEELRIRTKIHTRKNNKGFCNISVTIACKPKNIKNLDHSSYSLDDIYKLPTNLIYNSNR